MQTLTVDVDLRHLALSATTLHNSWNDGMVNIFVWTGDFTREARQMLRMGTTTRDLAPVLFPGDMDMCFLAGWCDYCQAPECRILERTIEDECLDSIAAAMDSFLEAQTAQ